MVLELFNHNACMQHTVWLISKQIIKAKIHSVIGLLSPTLLKEKKELYLCSKLYERSSKIGDAYHSNLLHLKQF